jgi:hypothetical protein
VVEARITPAGPHPRMDLRGRTIAGLNILDRQPLNFTVAAMAEEVESLVNGFGPDLIVASD